MVVSSDLLHAQFFNSFEGNGQKPENIKKEYNFKYWNFWYFFEGQ